MYIYHVYDSALCDMCFSIVTFASTMLLGSLLLSDVSSLETGKGAGFN